MNEEKDNPENWKLGIFYFNPHDQRLFLPKRNPAFGITINFSNPGSYLIIALLLFIVFLLVKLS